MNITDFLVVDSETRKENLNKYFSEFYTLLGGYRKATGDFNDYPYAILAKRDEVISKLINIPSIQMLKSNASDKSARKFGYINKCNKYYKLQARRTLDFTSTLQDHNNTLISSSCLTKDFIMLALNDSFSFTGYPSIIWHSHIDIKEPNTLALSDQWHYDNHYHPLMHKMILYCQNNPIEEGGGKTEIISSSDSYAYTVRTSYIGITPQREIFSRIEQQSGENIRSYLSESISDFTSGSSIFFTPSQCLHRGVRPKSGRRITLTMSFLPFPIQNFDLELLADISIKVIQDTSNDIESDAPVFFKPSGK